MIKCPNKKLPEWKELVEAIGENDAYYVWDQNDGNSLDKAPNGEPSEQFQKLVEYFKGDRQEALKVRALTFSQGFKTYYGNKALDSKNEAILSPTDIVKLRQNANNTFQLDGFTQEQISILKEFTNHFNKIQDGLKNRINSVKRYAKKNIKLENELNSLISNLASSEAVEGTVQFVDHVQSSIANSIKFLNKPINEVNAKQIRQLSEDYIGFYKPLMDKVQYMLDTTDIFNDIPDYDLFKQRVLDLNAQLTIVNNKFNNLLRNKGSQELVKYLQSRNTPQQYIDKVLNWLDSPTNDNSLLSVWFGMSSESDNMVIASIANILTNTMNATDRQTYEKGTELVKVLQPAKTKYGDDVQTLLYEKTKDGKYTGYLVRDRNYGQFYTDQKAYMDKLAEKLKIAKDQNGLYLITDDNSQKWYDGLNEFYSKNAERKYKPEYYKLRNEMLSPITRDAINEIQEAINQVLDSVTIDDMVYDNLLNPQMYQRLIDLQREKKMLSAEFNLDGSPKSGDAAIIAKELRAFNEAVGVDNKFVPDWDRFRKDEAKVIEKYGANSPEYLLWKERNTRTRWTEEFYERIANLDRPNQSDTYNDLVEKRRQILSIYRNPVTGLVDDTISDRERALLRRLDQDIADAYVGAPPQQDAKDKFSDFATITPTEQYYKDYRAAQAMGDMYFTDWFDANHYEDFRGVIHPASYYTTLKPKDEFIDQYSETVPANRYSTLDKSSQYYNKNWDPNGPAIQPNKKVYDNSKAYKAVMSKPAVKKLYNAVLNTITESNRKISYITNVNNYKLPQIEAKMLRAISRQNGVLEQIKYVFSDVITTKSDDIDFVDEFATKPNGEPLKIIPTRFIKMLDNPNDISTDAVASAIQYYNMASNYENMSEQRDEIELLLNLLKTQQITTKQGIKQPGSSNIYQQAQLLVDRILYGKNKIPLKGELLGKDINFSKLLGNVREYITKVNLAYNLWSAGTSFFTDVTYTTLEAKVGRFFDLEDMAFARSQFSQSIPDILANTGNPLPIDKLSYLMQLNQVVKGNKETFDRLEDSQTIRAINQNFWFMGYTQADYTVKSHTLMATYHNYRLVPGHGFMSKQAYIQRFYPNDQKKGAVEFKQIKTTLWDAYDFKNGTGTVNKKYEKFVTESIKNEVMNRINVLSRRIDGTVREVDKGKVHAHAIASYVTQHRNFMIQGIHNRLKSKTFNLDLGVEEEGYYRTMGKFVKGLYSNKHFALADMLKDYNNLQEYEQYAISRTLNELALVTASTVVALSLATLVDGDDEYDTWLSQAITYLALRSAFEFRTMYNPMELMSMIKSPTAAFSWFDNAYGVLGVLNPFSYIYARSPFDLIDRGPYEGMPRVVRTISKLTPVKNIIEAQDPKSKRNYLQNQLMSF